MSVLLDTSELDNEIKLLNSKIDKVEGLLSEFINQHHAKKDALYTIKDICELFQITKATVWNWQNKGLLNPIKIDRSVYYTESEVNILLTSKQKAS